MPQTGVLTTRHGKVLEIRIDRPPANAISRAVSRDIYAALTTLNTDDELQAGIITGAGDRIFSGGWDLKEVDEAGYDAVTEYDPVVGHGPGGFAGISEFFDLGKPVIAAVNGAAVGGGMEICLACDLIIMADHAWFQLPELKRGLIPDGGGVQRLPRLVPANVARDLMLTGRRFEADEARHYGLVSETVPHDQLMPRALAVASEIASSAPLAIKALKEVLTWSDGRTVETLMRDVKVGGVELPTYQLMHHSEDLTEGIRAFIEKRNPNWKGR